MKLSLTFSAYPGGGTFAVMATFFAHYEVAVIFITNIHAIILINKMKKIFHLLQSSLGNKPWAGDFHIRTIRVRSPYLLGVKKSSFGTSYVVQPKGAHQEYLQHLSEVKTVFQATPTKQDPTCIYSTS